jgi:predicted nuclease of restriction endonuclease-like RecB superfamily
MQVEIHDSYKDFWKFVKLFKLMFWATPLVGGGYHVDLDGPISPFVQATTRYGRQFAAFLPALLLCERWKMKASVRPPGSRKPAVYALDTKSALRSHFKRSGEFDSRLEADFAADFADKFGSKRGRWLLSREDEVILLGDTVMIPDFALTHKKDWRRVLIELVGFWTKEYLRRKVEKVRAAQRRDLLLLVYEGVNLSKDRLEDIPGEVLYFKNKPVLKDVMDAVERVHVL